MITEGKVALFCSRELNADGYRPRYGAGLHWRRTDDTVDVSMFYLDALVPIPIRVHLFGDTTDETIACLVLESESPEALQVAKQGKLHRVPLTFAYPSVLEYEPNIESYDDSVITL